jgi:hypothetical protein
MLFVAALLGIVTGVLRLTMRDVDHSGWIIWGVTTPLWLLVWFPYFLVSYLKKRRAQ